MATIDKNVIKLDNIEEEEKQLECERVEKKHESSIIQEKLIREGNLLTVEQLEELRMGKCQLDERLKDLQNELKNLYDLIPLGLAGNILSEVV